ncbi:SigE family RNA polymerase sigma factor [Cryptosporangium phraense]|uniref:SigE family RNA polymerase sigma factor n=1 Tax=Cryptosporangium phraense TaxID=2593070 RepID=A0A545AH72_9ACTN|nr:SigE family RNA polymerase sigma factor [Cryptosporangium phraense]TQS40668.1 SigE family RNA polymerase sigma factor [Cryptosporangium phraense]
MAEAGRSDDAYREYVDGLIPGLRRVAYLLCQDWHRADDLVQSTLERLYRHWSKASKADAPAAYARTVLVRVFLGEQRMAWARRVVLLDRLPEDAAAAAPDLADRLALEAAMRELPPRQRAVLVLRFFCDLSVEETADALQCATGTVKSQAARGLDKLREALTDSAVVETRR